MTNMTSYKVNDIQKNVFDEANEFLRLVENSEYSKDDIMSQLPLVVNLIFACELYLKALLLAEGKNVEECKKLNHNLSSLFKSLSINRQNSINEWMKNFQKSDAFKLLDKIKLHFVELRYMFLEKDIKNFDIQLIGQFTYRIQYEASICIVGYDIKREK